FTLFTTSARGYGCRVKQLVTGKVPAGVDMQISIPEDIILYIDVHKMTEALLNLTINALQAITEPPGIVSIGAEKDGDNTNAVITIADTGRGIEEENLQKIFDPFFTTKNAENGTGLGLAVAYGIINKQKGSIQVESEKGKGTRFIITLPLHLEAEGTGSPGQTPLSRNDNV
ncbi:MAG: HAMP domain-containing histidine kinase, partial [Proteobacteria bacterium]|nr:HAMP domain-containing histidine kinase [Pseudomonadota bacterium]